MDKALLASDLVRDEANKPFPYDDATGQPLKRGDTLKGKLTIGVGRNLTDVGLSQSERFLLLQNDIEAVVDWLDKNIPWWVTLTEPRQRALANMTYNLRGKVLQFPKMLAALRAGNYPEAAEELLDSDFARQVGARAVRLATMMENG